LGEPKQPSEADVSRGKKKNSSSEGAAPKDDKAKSIGCQSEEKGRLEEEKKRKEHPCTIKQVSLNAGTLQFMW